MLALPISLQGLVAGLKPSILGLWVKCSTIVLLGHKHSRYNSNNALAWIHSSMLLFMVSGSVQFFCFPERLYCWALLVYCQTVRSAKALWRQGFIKWSFCYDLKMFKQKLLLKALLCNFYGATKLSITSLGLMTFSLTTLGMTSTQHNVLHKDFVLLIVCFYNIMLSVVMPVL